MWIYKPNKNGSYDVGFYTPSAMFVSVEFNLSQQDARIAVNYLNGGAGAYQKDQRKF
jgi:hypothetical protein